MQASTSSDSSHSHRRPARQRRRRGVQQSTPSLPSLSTLFTSLFLTHLLLPTSSSSQFALAAQKILIYSRTTGGYRHASIPRAISTIETLAKQAGVQTVATENKAHLNNKAWLRSFDALLFVSVSGDVMSGSGVENVKEYVQDGGAMMGVHSATDALIQYPWYGRLMGAFFNYHPQECNVTVDIATHSHPSTSFFTSNSWHTKDEVYNFLSNPRDLGYTVVLTADEKSYIDPVSPESVRAKMQGRPHPLAWYKEGNILTHPKGHKKIGGGVDDSAAAIRKGDVGTGGAGRSFYTALGHSKKQWDDEQFQKHVWGAVEWLLASPVIQSNSGNSSAPGSKFSGSPARSDSNLTGKPNGGKVGAASSSSSGSAMGSSTMSGNGDAVNGGAPPELVSSAAAAVDALPLAILLILSTTLAAIAASVVSL